MPGDLMPNVWRDEDEGDFWTRAPDYEDRGDFDLTTVDGLLDHLAHCEDEVVQGVRDGLNEWEKAAREREANTVPDDVDLLGWCAPPTGCNRVRWLAFVTKRDSATGVVLEGVCRTCMREAVVKSL